MASYGAIIFDNDGTLASSLAPHVDFCRRMNDKHKCGLSIPSEDDLPAMRSIAAAPMDNFLLRAGFPEGLVPELVQEYEDSFPTAHPVGPFAGVAQLLKGLSELGVPLAVVSSNTSVNVRAALGEELSGRFSLIYGIDNADRSKAVSIKLAMQKLGVEKAVYVGDTEKDAQCAGEAGCVFVGVNYGFEDMKAVGKHERVAESVEELGGVLQGLFR